MSLFNDEAKNVFVYDNSASIEYLTSSDYPLLNSSSTIYSNSTDLMDDMEYRCPSIVPNSFGRYVSMILFTVVCIIGLFGNSLVIYVVLR